MPYYHQSTLKVYVHKFRFNSSFNGMALQFYNATQRCSTARMKVGSSRQSSPAIEVATAAALAPHRTLPFFSRNRALP